jgi:hypothetical protein
MTAPPPTRGISIKSEIKVKTELLPPSLDSDEYNPSKELQEAFASLERRTSLHHVDNSPDVTRDEGTEFRIKREEEEHLYQSLAEPTSSLPSVSDPTEQSDYQPSEGLLEALASLPPGMVDLPFQFTGEAGGVKVKDEPSHVILPGKWLVCSSDRSIK